MREHMGLHRGKRQDNGEWVKGYLLVGGPDIFAGRAFICERIYSAYIDEGTLTLGGFVEVDPDTVGECTGVHDNKGTDIYEGDVVKADVRETAMEDFPGWGKRRVFTGNKHEARWTVEWKCFANFTGFQVYGKDRRFHRTLTTNVVWNCNVEVIGNIHDNPELMEGERE